MYVGEGPMWGEMFAIVACEQVYLVTERKRKANICCILAYLHLYI